MNQHYVPRVYLKNFAEKRGKEFYVNVFDKIKNSHFPSNIKGICSSRHLYTLDDNSIVSNDKMAIEKAYSGFLEPTYEEAYNVLTNNKVRYISNQQRANIIVGILHLYHRNPAYLNRILSKHLSNLKLRYEAAIIRKERGVTYLQLDFSFREFSYEEIEKEIKAKVFKMFKETHFRWTTEMSALHEFTIIQVDIINDYANFLTGDNPLSLENLFAENDEPFSKATEFSIPINKKYLVTISHDKTKRVNEIYRYYIRSGNANMVNQKIFDTSSRFIIGDKEIFRDLEVHQSIFTDTSIDRKMNSIEQILNNCDIHNQNEEYAEMLTHYLNLYKINGDLTSQEEWAMKNKMDEMGRNIKLSRIE